MGKKYPGAAFLAEIAATATFARPAALPRLEPAVKLRSGLKLGCLCDLKINQGAWKTSTKEETLKDPNLKVESSHGPIVYPDSTEARGPRASQCLGPYYQAAAIEEPTEWPRR